MSKTILWKIIQRHSACFEPSLSFYVVNIDVTDEKGIIYITIYSAFYNNHPSNGILGNGESFPKISPAPYV